jgi:hypothetical protein
MSADQRAMSPYRAFSMLIAVRPQDDSTGYD